MLEKKRKRCKENGTLGQDRRKCKDEWRKFKEPDARKNGGRLTQGIRKNGERLTQDSRNNGGRLKEENIRMNGGRLKNKIQGRMEVD